MAIFRKGILVLAFVCLAIKGYCMSLSGNPPEVDFGTINYLYGAAGFGKVTISETGTPSTSDSGNLVSQSGGAAGTVTFSLNVADRFLALFGTKFSLTINTNTYTATESCGQVTISNVHSTNGASTVEQSTSGSSVSLPIGASLTVDSFTGSTSCTITKTFDSVMTGKLSGSASAGLKIRVTLVPNMAVEHNSSASLNFGRICTVATQQTITVAPNGNVSSTNLFCPHQGTGADAFTVTGNIGQSFSVSLPSTVTITNGSDSLTVSNLTSSCSSNCTLTDHTYNFTVGGTLTVPANTPTGNYQGNYQVTITY